MVACMRMLLMVVLIGFVCVLYAKVDTKYLCKYKFLFLIYLLSGLFLTGITTAAASTCSYKSKSCQLCYCV